MTGPEVTRILLLTTSVAVGVALVLRAIIARNSKRVEAELEPSEHKLEPSEVWSATRPQ